MEHLVDHCHRLGRVQVGEEEDRLGRVPWVVEVGVVRLLGRVLVEVEEEGGHQYRSGRALVEVEVGVVHRLGMVPEVVEVEVEVEGLPWIRKELVAEEVEALRGMVLVGVVAVAVALVPLFAGMVLEGVVAVVDCWPVLVSRSLALEVALVPGSMDLSLT